MKSKMTKLNASKGNVACGASSRSSRTLSFCTWNPFLFYSLQRELREQRIHAVRECLLRACMEPGRHWTTVHAVKNTQNGRKRGKLTNNTSFSPCCCAPSSCMQYPSLPYPWVLVLALTLEFLSFPLEGNIQLSCLLQGFLLSMSLISCVDNGKWPCQVKIKTTISFNL